ncbi:MAG: hypothetical protein M3Q17_10415 [Actinomycetota bacterium]|nr:hypothetical protein [Actinomycetota bacterium]
MPVDMKTVPKNDLGALAAFAVAFILSLLGSYISFSVDVPEEARGLVGETSGGVSSAWTSYATLGMLLLIAAAAIVAVRVFAAHVLPSGVPWQLIALGAAALGTLLIILRAVTYSESYGFGDFSSSSGPGWSGYALFVAAIAQTVFTALGFRESGETTPWANRTSGGTTTATPGSHSAGKAATGPTTAPPPPAAGPASSVPPATPAPPPPSTPPSTPPPPPPPA